MVTKAPRSTGRERVAGAIEPSADRWPRNAARIRPTARAPRRRPLRTIAFLVLIALALPPAVLGASALHFFWIVDQGERLPARPADAIVALSGDPARITQAVALLVQGKGRRLFITGVDNEDEVARQRALYPDLFACCVEVDHRAMNTNEDGAAIARWARGRDVGSLLVVTSSPHLPRALIEINDALPGVRTYPSAVTTGLYDYRGWRTDPDKWHWFVREYVKSLGALFRNRFPWLWPRAWDAPGVSLRDVRLAGAGCGVRSAPDPLPAGGAAAMPLRKVPV